MSKPLGKLYAKLRGRNPRFLDSLNYTTHSFVFAAFAGAGFVDFRDLYLEDLGNKFDDPATFTRPRLRRIGRALRRLRLLHVVKATCLALRVTPAIFLVARKPGSSNIREGKGRWD
jgi:hypothetical protein